MSFYLVRWPGAPREARTQAVNEAGQVARDMVARCGAVRAYGVTAANESDFIDVQWEEVGATQVVGCLSRGSSMRALPSGDHEV